MSDICTVCGLPIEVGDYPCIATARPHQRGINGAIGDECDIWQENGFHHPRHFTSKAERVRALAEKGLEERVCNAGIHDTLVAKWSTMDPQTMRNAEILASRNGSARGNDAPERPLDVNWTVRELES